MTSESPHYPIFEILDITMHTLSPVKQLLLSVNVSMSSYAFRTAMFDEPFYSVFDFKPCSCYLYSIERSFLRVRRTYQILCFMNNNLSISDTHKCKFTFDLLSKKSAYDAEQRSLYLYLLVLIYSPGRKYA